LTQETKQPTSTLSACFYDSAAVLARAGCWLAAAATGGDDRIPESRESHASRTPRWTAHHLGGRRRAAAHADARHFSTNAPAFVKMEPIDDNHPHHQPEESTMTAPALENRRRFIKLGVAGLAAAPLAAALFNGAAEAAETLSESDPMAVALGYKADATKAPGRKDNTATCANCNFYSGKPGAADGPCSVFGGKLVAAKGWCNAWAKKA